MATVRDLEGRGGGHGHLTRYNGQRVLRTFVFSTDSGWHYVYAELWEFQESWLLRIGQSRNWVTAVDLMEAWTAAHNNCIQQLRWVLAYTEYEQSSENST